MGVYGEIIDKIAIENVYKQHPEISPKEMADIFGVHLSTMTYALQWYGFIPKKERKNAAPFEGENNLITDEDVHRVLNENAFLTVAEIADLLQTSPSRVERARREGNFEPLPKGRKISYTEEELKKKVLQLITKEKITRKEIANHLGVTEPTVLNYAKKLIKDGLLPEDFTFRNMKTFKE